MEHAGFCLDSSKCVTLGAANVSPLDHGDIRPLTSVAEHAQVMPTMNYRILPLVIVCGRTTLVAIDNAGECSVIQRANSQTGKLIK